LKHPAIADRIVILAIVVADRKCEKHPKLKNNRVDIPTHRAVLLLGVVLAAGLVPLVMRVDDFVRLSAGKSQAV
jgi:uncharacterized membrane-anchored protein